MIMTVGLASCVALTVADIIVVVITWIKTFHQVKEAARLGVKVNISATLLRDGKESCFISILPYLIGNIQEACASCMYRIVLCELVTEQS